MLSYASKTRAGTSLQYYIFLSFPYHKCFVWSGIWENNWRVHHCSISQSYLQIPIFQEVERNEMHLQVNQSTYPFYHSTSFVNHYLGNLNKNKGSSQARCLIWNVNHNYEKLPLHKPNDLFPLRSTFNNFEKLIVFFSVSIWKNYSAKEQPYML